MHHFARVQGVAEKGKSRPRNVGTKPRGDTAREIRSFDAATKRRVSRLKPHPADAMRDN